MRLNRIEFGLMNNAVRAASQRWIEASVLLRAAELRPGARVLEVGCGRGVGLEILDARFPGGFKVGFDLDPAMVKLARERVDGAGLTAGVSVADAERLPFEDGAFDAVVEFAILHHVPGWRGALREIARVLRPGGSFWFEDLTSTFSESRLASLVLDHPRGLAIHADSFGEGLRAAGLVVESLRPVTPLGFFGHARRPGGPASDQASQPS